MSDFLVHPAFFYVNHYWAAEAKKFHYVSPVPRGIPPPNTFTIARRYDIGD
jgi:hypothetical protein